MGRNMTRGKYCTDDAVCQNVSFYIFFLTFSHFLWPNHTWLSSTRLLSAYPRGYQSGFKFSVQWMFKPPGFRAFSDTYPNTQVTSVFKRFLVLVCPSKTENISPKVTEHGKFVGPASHNQSIADHLNLHGKNIIAVTHEYYPCLSCRSCLSNAFSPKVTAVRICQ